MKQDGQTSLVLMGKAAKMLAEATTVQQAKELKDLAFESIGEEPEVSTSDWRRVWDALGLTRIRDELTKWLTAPGRSEPAMSRAGTQYRGLPPSGDDVRDGC